MKRGSSVTGYSRSFKLSTAPYRGKYDGGRRSAVGGLYQSYSEAFRQEIRAENEVFRQEVWGRFDKVDERFERIDERFERMEGRLFDMQRSLTVQTRWLVGLLVAAPVIYSVMEKLLGLLP